MSIQEHYENVVIRQRTPCSIFPDGSCLYYPEGYKPMNEKEFKATFPLSIISRDMGKGRNFDTTKEWMY